VNNLTAYESEVDHSSRHRASKQSLGLRKYFHRGSRRSTEDTNYDSDASSVCSSSSRRGLFRLGSKRHALLGDDDD